MKPILAKHVRLTYSSARKSPVLLLPETVLVLNDTGAAILELCDGTRTLEELTDELGRRYRMVPAAEVRGFLRDLAARRCVELVSADG